MPCRSESVLSLKLGLQEARWRTGRGAAVYLQTDQSSTATHQLKRGQSARGFNAEYVALCEHLGSRPRTIAVASPNQNGDVEAAQGDLKRRLKQSICSCAAAATLPCALITPRSSPRFARQPTRCAPPKLAEERACLRPLPAARFPEAEVITVRVSSYSTARVNDCAYSVPSRLIGAFAQAHGSAKRRCASTTARKKWRVIRARIGRAAAHRLPARHRLVGAQARRLRALSLPRGAVSRGRSSGKLTTGCTPSRSARRARATCACCSWPPRSAKTAWPTRSARSCARANCRWPM